MVAEPRSSPLAGPSRPLRGARYFDMSSNLGLIIAFVLVFLPALFVLARRDALMAGFMFFFFVYTIFAMVGYGMFPIISEAMQLYWGNGAFQIFVAFVIASYLGFTVVATQLNRRFVRSGRFRVEYRPSAKWKMLGYIGVSLFTAWMSWRLHVLWPHIDYSAVPQIPDKAYQFAFKNTVLVLMVLWAVSRRHAGSPIERGWAIALLLLLGRVFVLTALRAGNRTDIVALTCGLLFYELYDHLVSDDGGLRAKLTPQQLKALLGACAAAVAAYAFMRFVQENRERTDMALLPTYARVLVQDYYSPAHMLLASISLHYIQPLELLKSNLANSFFVGGVLGIPYPQDPLGNMIVLGSASRSTGYGYFIFSEGWMAAGAWGVLYNAIVPAVGLTLWRRMSTSDDRAYNAFAASICALFFAVVARTGTHLLLRNYIFVLIPGMLLFRMFTGAAHVRLQPSPDHD
jgi:hypothetical protein